MPLFSVGQYTSACAALQENKPILAVMKSLDRLSQELEWRKHANSVLWHREDWFWHELWITGLAVLFSVEVHR